MDFLKVAKLFAQDFFAVPDYQRDYEWINAQNSTLIDDVFSVMQDSDKKTHFLGAIVTIPFESGNSTNSSINFDEYSIDVANVKHVVDGQQRLTSYSVLIKSLFDIIKEDTSLDDTFKDNHLSILRVIFRGTAYNANGAAAPRLILNGNTGRCFNSHIMGLKQESFNRGLRGAKRLINAYNLFKSEILSKRDELIELHQYENAQAFYKALVDALTNKIVFVEIQCDASSNAFQVFDSLNGKGLDLTAADRIKNIMMSWTNSGQRAQKWEAFAQEVGEEYLANFFVALLFYKCGRRVSKNQLPDEFRNAYATLANNNYDQFYNDLRKAGKIYGNIRHMKTGEIDVDSLLKDLQALNLDQVYVIIFSVAYHYKDVLSTITFKAFLNALLCLVVRMQVCGKSMNKLDQIFVECIDMMKKHNKELSDLTERLKEKKKSLVSDYQFKVDFADFCPLSTKVEVFYLRALEEYRRMKEGNRSSVDDEVTVEHIIPQTLDDLSDWYGTVPIPEEIREDFQKEIVENIGNKALLYSDDNSSANNNNYQKKIVVYRTGKQGQQKGTPIETFQLIEDLLSHYPTRFNHEEVHKRAEELAEYAVSIW